MAIVFSLGGSIFQDKKLMKQYASYFEMLAKKQKVGIVLGGGKLARKYISQVKKTTSNEVIQHLFGIAATLENAEVFSSMLKDSNRIPPINYEEALEYSAMHSIVVMGGTIPFLTTDSNMVILAGLLDADKMINLTNVDYLCDKDPNKYKNAKKIEKISKEGFLEFVRKNDKRRPGEHFIIDYLAAYFATKVKAPLYIINGKRLNEVKKAVAGKKFKGTLVK